MSYYISPIKKQKKETKISVGRDDKRKKFHVIFVAKGIELPIPPNLKGQIKDVAFDFSCGIKADTLQEAYKEVQKLLTRGYVEEEAPSAI